MVSQRDQRLCTFSDFRRTRLLPVSVIREEDVGSAPSRLPRPLQPALERLNVSVLVPTLRPPLEQPLMVNRQIRVLHLLHSFDTGGLENGLVNLINGSPEYISHELLLL